MTNRSSAAAIGHVREPGSTFDSHSLVLMFGHISDIANDLDRSMDTNNIQNMNVSHIFIFCVIFIY